MRWSVSIGCLNCLIDTLLSFFAAAPIDGPPSTEYCLHVITPYLIPADLLRRLFFFWEALAPSHLLPPPLDGPLRGRELGSLQFQAPKLWQSVLFIS